MNIQIVKIVSKHQHGFMKWKEDQYGFMRWKEDQYGKWTRIPAPVKQGYCRVMAIIKFNGRILTKHIDVTFDLCNSHLQKKI